MIGGTLYLALIYLHPGQQDALRRYENLALPVFRRHGGRFERILSPARPASGQPDPDAPVPKGIVVRHSMKPGSGSSAAAAPDSRSAM
jgi:hypothetical protein